MDKYGYDDLCMRARDGDALAQLRLAQELLRTGQSKEAEDWMRKAADAGLPEANYELGILTESRAP